LLSIRINLFSIGYHGRPDEDEIFPNPARPKSSPDQANPIFLASFGIQMTHVIHSSSISH
jgi:hypothetical protein